MSFYDDMAALAVELLGPGSDFGEQLTIERPTGGYNQATRTTTAGAPLTMTVWGTTDADSLGAVSAPGALAATYERVLMAVPSTSPGAFTPGQGDRVIADRTYQVEKTAHVVKAGKAILWMAGLATA